MFRTVAALGVAILAASPALAESLRIAAAADLKFALDEIIAEFRREHPGEAVEVVYGSSGNFHTQILQGAPYDMYFAADIEYPLELAKSGFAASDVRPYAVGRIVLRSAELDASALSLEDLPALDVEKIAMPIPLTRPTGNVPKKRFAPRVSGTRSSRSWFTARTSRKPRSSCNRGTRRSGSSPCRSRSARNSERSAGTT